MITTFITFTDAASIRIEKMTGQKANWIRIEVTNVDGSKTSTDVFAGKDMPELLIDKHIPAITIDGDPS